MKSSTVDAMDVDHHHLKSFGVLMKMKNIRVFDLTVLSLLFVCLFYIFLISPSSYDNPFFPLKKYSQCPSTPSTIMQNTSNDQHNTSSYQHNTSSDQHHTSSYRDELEEVLAKTATEKKTLIIAVLNKAYVEGDKSMLDLFLDSFWLGENTQALRDHLLIVAVDQTSYERCRFLRLHCYKLETEGVDFAGEQIFMSRDYLKMMWRRTEFLGDVLKRGYNFIFTDTDIMWLRNPFSKLDNSFDLQISTDKFNGNERSKANRINAGFYVFRSNKKTIALYNSWLASKENSTGLNEQDVLQRLLKQPNLGLSVRYLDTLYFNGFCQNSREVRAVVTVHANCCTTIGAKLVDLTTVLRDWKRFKKNSTNETFTFDWSDRVACRRPSKG
ncbi:hypothetical protein Vadar_014137 [Vaccinium darrowii]|uniref:Uncharacterized protein n=1 Tax=Vaccinium darrowii TaxID=229202 RepID=A0ACB7XHK1_9ERIC|nr:hypothetical protein Vadar_014137 [Vaccinium darrowii]